jgi:hypothetical protein
VTLDPPHRLIVRRPRGKFFARPLHLAEALADTRSCRKPLLCLTAEVAPCADRQSEAGASQTGANAILPEYWKSAWFGRSGKSIDECQMEPPPKPTESSRRPPTTGATARMP